MSSIRIFILTPVLIITFINHHWFFGVISYLIFRLSGFGGINSILYFSFACRSVISF